MSNVSAINDKKKKVIAPLHKRLLDMYKTAELVEFADDEGDFAIWVQKNDPWEEKSAITKSRSVRGPIIARKKALKAGKLSEEDLEEYVDVMEEWGIGTREMQVLFLISPRIQELQETAMARIANEDKWSKEDYLSSLQDAWNGGLDDVFLIGEPDEGEDRTEYEKAKITYEALVEYTEQVEEDISHTRDEMILEFDDVADEKIQADVIDQIIDSEANAAQVGELNLWRLYYACRSADDHSQKIFESKDQLGHLDEKIIKRLLHIYEEISIGGIEGKG